MHNASQYSPIALLARIGGRAGFYGSLDHRKWYAVETLAELVASALC